MIKRNMARRQAPEGEDIKSIKKILREIGTKKIPVHEFINLISPYTADNGALLRLVLAEDVDAFQKLARKVYETMTEDVSDVLVNEQLHMMEFYQEKRDIYLNKMMAAINEIYDMAPEFDFDRYIREKDQYLHRILPFPVIGEVRDEEGNEMMKRQQAYHRLQWLRSEGERLNEENKRLMNRLDQLKELQRVEQQKMTDMAERAEAKRMQLTQEERIKKDELEQLNQSVSKSFVETETEIKKEYNMMGIQPPEEEPKKKKKLKVKRPAWISEAAVEIEDVGVKEAIASERNAMPPPVRLPVALQSCRTCPADQGGRGLPFRQPQGGFGADRRPPRQMETNIEKAQATIQIRRPQPEPSRGRRVQGPKETWGGFN
ncbi:unnamed protein product [Acanthoscelides obtectus]|nr:unnamed protein product [Acanthoscelides obtectus]CAK1661579.1 hypothetical protein AOBTE_LOCUS22696 [Acanthoscelides obtectus]